MKRLLRWSAAAALVAALALSFRPSTSQASGLDGPSPLASTHTVSIEYQQRRGDLRRAVIKIVPKERARAPWRGQIAGVAFLPANGKSWIIIQSLQANRDGSYEGRAMLPGPREIAAMMVHTSEGESLSWGNPDWVAQQDDGGDEDPPKEDPPAEDPPADDPPDDGDEGDCSGVDCVGIINPWTCECDEEIKDPWENEGFSAQMLRFGI